jgi:hypothetical protein
MTKLAPVGAAMALTLAAQDATAARHPRVHQVNRRFENQQDRIANGARSGSLTARETARLERRGSRPEGARKTGPGHAWGPSDSARAGAVESPGKSTESLDLSAEARRANASY